MGKPKKVALTACMRKLWVILNAMAKHGREWQPSLKTPWHLRQLLSTSKGLLASDGCC